VRRRDSDRDPVHDGVARRNVDELARGEEVVADAGILTRNRKLCTGSVVTPSVRQTNHANRHFVGDLDRNIDRAHRRGDGRKHAVVETCGSSIVRVHQ
jgi:hypothetical protein